MAELRYLLLNVFQLPCHFCFMYYNILYHLFVDSFIIIYNILQVKYIPLVSLEILSVFSLSSSMLSLMKLSSISVAGQWTGSTPEQCHTCILGIQEMVCCLPCNSALDVPHMHTHLDHQQGISSKC